MYHEATACHVTGDLVELLSIFLSVLKATRPYLQRKGVWDSEAPTALGFSRVPLVVCVLLNRFYIDCVDVAAGPVFSLFISHLHYNSIAHSC